MIPKRHLSRGILLGSLGYSKKALTRLSIGKRSVEDRSDQQNGALNSADEANASPRPASAPTSEGGQKLPEPVPDTIIDAKKQSPDQPLPALTYAFLSLVAFFIGIGLLCLFVFKSRDLVASGIDRAVFYVLLLPLGLSAAAFLFGAMKSYAALRHRSVGGAWELGGPAAIFALVVAGGFYLVPDAQSFDFTVLLRDKSGATAVRNSGVLRITLENDVKPAKITDDGAADFKGYSSEVEGI